MDNRNENYTTQTSKSKTERTSLIALILSVLQAVVTFFLNICVKSQLGSMY